MKPVCNLITLVFAIIASIPATFATVELSLDASSANQLTMSHNNGVYTLTTTGSDPFVATYGLPSACRLADYKLEFQYQSTADIDNLQLFFMSPTASEEKSLHTGSVIKKSSQWVNASINIANPKSAFGWGTQGQRLRLDFGSKPGVTVKIRNLCINGSYTLSEAEKEKEAIAITKYLSNNYASAITNVEVTTDHVIITGNANISGKIIEAPLYAGLATMTNCETVATVNAGNFEITVPRYATYGGYTYDRILSRWALTNSNGELQSHGHYADVVAKLRSAEPGILNGKKGIGAVGSWNFYDLDPLGINCVTLNIFLCDLLSMTPNDKTTPYEYCGLTYYINNEQLAYYDQVLNECYNRGIIVCAILLDSAGKDPAFSAVMCHPENEGGNYSMPNITNMEGVHAYAAVIDMLASRYTQPGNGRVHHWIMHNEVDMHTTWTNMGASQPLTRLVDHYEKSMRLVSQIVCQYDQNAYVLPSFTSSWTKTHGVNCHAGKQILEQINCYSTAEGDFRWGVAAHPYPIDFFKPRFWQQDTEATYAENSGYLTFKNIELISNWIMRREHYYKGREKRMLFLSENGVNAISPTTENLTVQAAGAAWAWKKATKNAGVDGIMWHNWQDHPAEAADGLLLGLRDANGNARPSWYVWQAAGTSSEASVLDQYKSVIGISDWNSIHHPTIATDGDESILILPDLTTANGMTCQFSNTEQAYSMNCATDDPMIMTEPLSAPISSVSNVLSFEYKSDRDLAFQIFFGNDIQEKHSITSHLKATENGEWQRIYINIVAMRNLTGWGTSGSKLRLDPGTGWNAANKCTFQIRHLCINSGEIENAHRLALTTENSNQCNISIDNTVDEVTIATTGTDPYIYTQPLTCNLTSSANKLIFEYQASTDIDDFMCYFYPNSSEYRSAHLGNLQASANWKLAILDLSDNIKKSGWGFEGDYLRIDPGRQLGVTLKMRTLRVANNTFVDELPLTLDQRDANDLSLSHDIDNTQSTSAEKYNGWVANTTGTDPYLFTNPLTANLNNHANYLHIIYKSNADITPLEIFFMEPLTATRAKKYNAIMPATDQWCHIAIPIETPRRDFGWGYAGDILRIDPGNNIGTNLQIKSLYISHSNSTTDAHTIEIPENEQIRLYSTQGGLCIDTNTPQTVNIYNLMGIRVATTYINGTTFIPLPTGIYIANGKKIIII